MTGIIGYQIYIPRYRITSKEIRAIWGLSASGINEKSVPYKDEDSISMGLASALNLLNNLELNLTTIGSLYFASISSPYIDKPVSTLLVSMLGLNENVFTSDFGGSAQAGAMALINCKNMVFNTNSNGLIIISDCLKSRPGSVLERSLGAGAISILIGNDNPVASITGNYSYSIEISDRWKGVNSDYKVGDERFTREFGFIPSIKNAILGLLESTNKDLNDFKHIVIQQPNGKAPEYIAKSMKFDKNKLKEGNIANYFGDLGAASVFIGLAKVLDSANSGDEILIVAYSSGGSQAISLKVTDNIKTFRSNPPVQYFIENKIIVNYSKYLQFLGQI
ncbi:MAG: hydroxymethylglutaryl-CoA synthase [Candidatus Helarchaeota archaeon]